MRWQGMFLLPLTQSRLSFTLCHMSRVVTSFTPLRHIQRNKNTYLQLEANQFEVKSSTNFYHDVIQFLNDTSISWCERNICGKKILAIEPIENGNEFKLGLHLINGTAYLDPKTCKDLTDNRKLPFKTLIHLHEDVWHNKNDIAKARILAKLNRINNRWFARKTHVRRIPKATAIEFLEEHHLWGSTRAKFNYGLFVKNSNGQEEDLIAVATFSPRRHINRHEGSRLFRSHELIRYCSKKDETVVGGITKLIARFCNEFAPDDLVTCIDRDWGDGGGWAKLGFESVQIMPPLVMVIEGKAKRFTRKYLVGAGMDTIEKKDKARQGRPRADYDVLKELEQVENCEMANQCLLKHGLYPVFDAGVERRMLVIDEVSTLHRHAKSKRHELGLEDIVVPDFINVMDLWGQSSPSFPKKYYSANKGVNFLLESSCSR